MKKAVVFLSLLSSIYFFGQKSENFLQISYNSICCGTPSSTPVKNFLDNFAKNSKIKNLEVLKSRTLGREGEYILYVGIDGLSHKKKKELIKGLTETISEQNKLKIKNRQGEVYFNATEKLKKNELQLSPNLEIIKNK